MGVIVHGQVASSCLQGDLEAAGTDSNSCPYQYRYHIKLIINYGSITICMRLSPTAPGALLSLEGLGAGSIWATPARISWAWLRWNPIFIVFLRWSFLRRWGRITLNSAWKADEPSSPSVCTPHPRTIFSICLCTVHLRFFKLLHSEMHTYL